MISEWVTEADLGGWGAGELLSAYKEKMKSRPYNARHAKYRRHKGDALSYPFSPEGFFLGFIEAPGISTACQVRSGKKCRCQFINSGATSAPAIRRRTIQCA
jgi:hypothetical protein